MTQGSAGLPSSRLVAFRPSSQTSGSAQDKPSKPLFAFPSLYDEPEVFEDLAQQLGSNRPMFGLRHIGANQECEPIRDVSRAAQLYADELRRAEPHGPYYLFGYAFGGAVAFEVARELDSQGHKVGLVILADCAVYGHPKRAPAWRRARIHYRKLREGSNSERVQYLRQRLDSTAVRLKRSLGVAVENEHTDTRDGQRHSETRIALPRQGQALRVQAALEAAERDYRPSPQGVDVLFLRSETRETLSDGPTITMDDPLLGWGPALRGRISQCPVPGVRSNKFAQADVTVLAERMRSALAQAERRHEHTTSAVVPISLSSST